ncbi:hypothetical protein SDRG_14820 [Saprolegnia diclina VS20]|uniref:Uncharacterized protein n=1 Tax=Saprolegnia diclina (strain VS20) TaxID=1156394 RepID=T0R5P3_SAPDV|nr:hypothetical protein SDRG_14820 [Saprolegnia diclina VS20]EQC27378.1 hypothetical protein SDRG_14820 [Saprolegnia diclina VS20]|eukprot:XP_008619197.1 hypothetical protein SDRG_14820 [Saprolegnia diclina VS20]
MLPELIELIAVYIAQPYDLLRYLDAVENGLRLPFRSLRALLSASLRSPGLRLWPALVLPLSSHDASLRQYASDCIELFSIVRVRSLEAHGITSLLRPATLLSLGPLTTPDEVRAVCMAPWRARLVALELHLWDRLLAHDVWTPTSLALLGACVRSQPQLASLRLRWQLDQSHDAFQHVLSDVLDLGRSLSHLALSFNEASKVVWNEALATRLGSWLCTSRVTSLALDGLRFDSMHAATRLVASLHGAPLLRELRLDSLQLERALSRAALPPALRSLCVHGASLLPQWRTAAHLSTLALHFEFQYKTSGKSGPCCRIFDLQHDADQEALVALLPQLTELHLDTNSLGNAGALRLIATLHECRYLQVLSLIQQGVTDVSAIAFATAERPSTLRTLRLGRNHVTCVGATALCHVIPHLDVLDLSRNRIRYDGAKAISNVLPLTTHMRTLDVQMNPLSEAGVLVLVAALGRETALRAGVLDLSATVSRAYVPPCRAAIKSLPCPHYVVFRC